jgi:hypothetical protein
MLTLPTENCDGVHTVTIAYAVTPPAVPMMSEDRGLGTTFVVTGKLALVAPAGTVTLAGTVAAVGSSLVRGTTTPPLGAAEASVTVPVTEVPPRTSVGLTRTVESAGAGALGGGGAGVGGEGGGGGDVELGVQPESVALVAVADPSLMLTRQSPGLAKPSRWMFIRPLESLDPTAKPFAVMVRLAVAVPSRRS